MQSWPALLCSVALTLAVALPASATEPPENKTLSPYFHVENGDPDVDRLPLAKTAIAVKVSGVIADVTVRQTYKNDGSRPINAKYVFPASTRAAVHGMTMTVGGHVIEAKIKEREQARREFEAAKQTGKSASLLEQQRPNVFTMGVANVMPGDRIDVELRYTELLVPTGGVYEFVYPTVVGPRYSSQPEGTALETDRWVKSPYTKQGKEPTYDFELTGTLATGMPLQDLSCPSHELHTTWRDKASVDIELDAAERSGGNRDFILRYRLADGAIATGLMLHEGAHENFFLLTVQPPKRVTTAQIPSREYVFVVDVSGSMHGFPLDTAKELLRDLVGNLRPTDTFNVILFSGTAHLMAPRSVPATATNVNKALRVIDEQPGGGGTELLKALEVAMSLPHDAGASRSFVVVTDGYISAEKNAFDYIREHLGDANVFSFGIGSGVNRYLLEGIAKAGMGEPFVVTEPAGARGEAEKFRDYIQTPVLTNIGVHFDGFEVYDVQPATVPDVLAERPIIVHGKWKSRPKGRIVVYGLSGEGRYKHEFDVASIRPSRAHKALPYLWARSRLSDLSDFNFGSHGEPNKEEITDLGLHYNLLTKYTSFIAVHRVVRNFGGLAKDVPQPLPLPDGVSDQAVGVSMEVGPEPELYVLFVVVVVAAVLASQRRRLWAIG